MARPKIGITIDHTNALTAYEHPYGYSLAVDRAGGLPILLPYKVNTSLVNEYVDLLDGIIFSGGPDLDPAAWGETYHPKCVPIDPARERFERALLAEVERRRIPTLGICLGSQLMNVHRGGSLHQFIPDHFPNSLEHRRMEKDVEQRHPVKLQGDSSMKRILPGEEILANSSHKQAVNKVGRGMRIIATSPDGVIEATEDSTYPLWLAVQWHPERLADEADHFALFKLLVDKSSSGK